MSFIIAFLPGGRKKKNLKTKQKKTKLLVLQEQAPFLAGNYVMKKT